MSKEMELSRWGAIDRLLLFIKLRKGKYITEKTIKDFEKLTDKMSRNFKSYNDYEVSEWRMKEFTSQSTAMKAIQSRFMKWEGGGNCRLSDIDSFSLYKDKKYRVSIKGDLVEITERDFLVLQFIFFGEV